MSAAAGDPETDRNFSGFFVVSARHAEPSGRMLPIALSDGQGEQIFFKSAQKTVRTTWVRSQGPFVRPP
jgi:hypothetical protein